MTGRKQTAVSELQSTPDASCSNILSGRCRVVISSHQGKLHTVRTTMLHLAHQPPFPTGNKYLQQRWDKASYDLHRRKVKSAKPTISTTPPKTYSHLTLKLKKQKLEEEWKLKIEKENDMLMEKIAYIMKTTGAVDNKNFYEKKSLGKEMRQLELLRISKENQMILFRLSQCRPHYNVRSWHEDWLKTLKVMDSIAHYPRGRTNQQKGQDKARKQSSSCDKNQKISTEATTHSPANHKTNGKVESERSEKKKGNSKNTGTEIQQDTDTNPVSELHVPEKTTSPDTAESPGSSDTVQITTDNPPHSDEQPLACDGPEVSNPNQETTTTDGP